jgi:hypothetical protein
MTVVERNMNPQVFWERKAAAHRPRYRFAGKTSDDFRGWRDALLPQLLATLGTPPREVPLNPRLVTEWHEGGLIRQRWIIDVQEGLSTPLWVLRPEEPLPGVSGGRPAVMCCHGHSEHGSKDMMGVPYEGCTERRNIDYGVELAQAGFITYAIDWLGFGERAYHLKPHYYGGLGGRDKCNVMALCANLLGTTVLASNLHDARRATDFICSQPFVDPRRLGVMGHSLGGTMAIWISLYDNRFIAADCSGYNGPFYNIAFTYHNACGSQITPGLLDLCDVADLQGLVAPRPLLIEIAVHDEVFLIDHTLKQFRQTQAIYEAAGVPESLELDLFGAQHSWGGHKTHDFFRKHLQCNGTNA